MIRETAAGIEVDVRVIPRARKTEIAGTRAGAVLIRLAAPPVDDAANAALIELLARQLDLPQRSIRVISGERTRHKRLGIVGITAAMAARRLGVNS